MYINNCTTQFQKVQNIEANAARPSRSKLLLALTLNQLALGQSF